MLKLSCVIPAYNAEPFVARCLDSILSQPCGGYEIIVVDDGSTDGTSAILACYAEKHSHLRVFTQPNSGQGAARTLGIGQAQGEYIWFLDADDWCSENSLPRIFQRLNAHAPDVLLINYLLEYDDRAPTAASIVGPQIAGRLLDPTVIDEPGFASICCWNAQPFRLITRRSLLVDNGIGFPGGLFYEDHPFAIRLMRHARSVYVDSTISYHYYQRAGSTTRIDSRRVFDFLEIRRICLGLFREYNWRERFPNLYLSYMFPKDFYKYHVPRQYRTEFLKALGSTLTDEDYAAAAHVPGADPQLCAYARAVRYNSDWLWRLSRFAYGLVAAIKSGARTRLRKTLRNVLRQVKRSIKRLLNWVRTGVPHVGPDPSLVVAGPGVSLDDIRIEVRRAREVRPYVHLGEYADVHCDCIFELGKGRIRIGDRSSVGTGSLIVCSQDAGITIGDHVMLSWGCSVVDTDSHSLDPDLRHNDAYHWKLGTDVGCIGLFKDWTGIRSAPVVIEDHAWIGFGASILRGVTIGRGAVVGAKSVVTRDVPAYTVFAGNPARFVRLVPRQNGWKRDELLRALQVDPKSQAMLHNACLHRDAKESLRRLLAGREWTMVSRLLTTYVPKGSRILHVDCANGAAAAALALAGYNVTASDASDSAVFGIRAAERLLKESGQLRAEGANERLRFIQAAPYAPPADGPYDVVYCHHALHRWADPGYTLACLVTSLRPGGLLIAAGLPLATSESARQNLQASDPLIAHCGLGNAFTALEYEALLQKGHLEALEQYDYPSEFPHNAVCQIVLARRVA